MKQKLSRSLFLIPALALLSIFVVYPVVNTLYLSFLSPEGKFVFLSNYADLLTRREIINPRGFARGFAFGALPHNLLWTLIHLPLTVFFGLLLAVILRHVKGGVIIKSVIFLGMVTPMIIGGVLLRFIFDGRAGIVPVVLSIFNVAPRTLTAHPDTALIALILGSVWIWAGFSMVLYSAGLETIPKELYEAAQIDGATPRHIFFKITIPMLKPITTVVVTMTLLWNLRIFDIVYAATMGGPGGATNVLALQMFFYAFRRLEFNSAAVVATILMLLAMVAATPMIRSAWRESR
ncbi:sugar ABC transporter permease [Candidatus Acetothermia bacterium]|jgi:multiple sugar transport system permease protein|nr:sugar ABC transporter permease [Candidatus Acetothermia bacterium]MCI2426917.1 sugar ABC transporter permease [Candidatus Acetothermia bacterium]MCI2428872.1 sugar ABC transporter permease [Candidatus Acetothermia bacterium]